MVEFLLQIHRFVLVNLTVEPFVQGGRLKKQLWVHAKFSHYVEALERVTKVQLHVSFLFVFLQGELRHYHMLSTVHLLAHMTEDLLGERHQVSVVRIREVEFETGELGVVAVVNALVPKHLTNLVDAVETTDDQLLEE